MTKPKVFVSYSWKVEKQTNIVAELEEQCQLREIELILDKNVLKHGDRIKTFMDDLAKAEHVITVFSKPYFKSKWCMYELLHTFDKGEFQKRAHHLIADDCDLKDADYRIAISDFWKEQDSLAEARITGRDARFIQDEVEYAKQIHNIFEKINVMMNFAAGSSITELSDLKANNYTQLLDSIKLAPVAETPKFSSKTQLPNTPDSAFITEIKRKIAEELNSPDVVQFRGLLKLELDKVLDRLNLAKIADNRADLIADGLIQALKLGGSEVPVITSVLTAAAMHCFDRKKGKYFQATRDQHEAIKEVIEQILGWLVLASVSDTYAQDLQPETKFPGIYFELPAQTAGGVEVIVSRSFQRQAKFLSKGNVISSSYQLLTSTDQFSWKASETVALLKRMLWNQVFPDENKDTSITVKETSRLNAELEIRRVDKWAGEHHVLAIESQALVDDNSRFEVYQQLLTELDNLTLVYFGLAEQSPIFCTPEYQLMAAINNFLKKINQTLNS